MGEHAASHRCAFDGDLTVRSAARIQAQLIDAFDGHRAVEIDCSGATHVDLSFVQLLLAARRSAAASGARLTLTHPSGGALHDAVLRAGIATDACAADRAFWLNTTEGNR
ncbi:STAS domain-containing protein [Aquabacter sp. CN5-332]|uniref:STAS domain-containing protein n=1 Tax=Aquabacter sp. CN5-332 TaxID=3156608 RepID=UPI0032B58839